MTSFEVLRMLLNKSATTYDIQQTVIDYWAKTHVGDLMKRLEHEGKVKATKHGWEITPKGRKACEQADVRRPFTPYVPPTYPRRKGSLWSVTAPSRVADYLIFPKDKK